MDLPSYTPDFKPPFTLPDGRQLHAAYYRELPICIAQGYSPGEALNALRELLPLVIEQMRASQQPIPEPLPPPAMRSVAPVPQAAPTETEAAAISTCRTETFPSTTKVISFGSGAPPTTPVPGQFSFA